MLAAYDQQADGHRPQQATGFAWLCCGQGLVLQLRTWESLWPLLQDCSCLAFEACGLRSALHLQEIAEMPLLQPCTVMGKSCITGIAARPALR